MSVLFTRLRFTEANCGILAEIFQNMTTVDAVILLLTKGRSYSSDIQALLLENGV